MTFDVHDEDKHTDQFEGPLISIFLETTVPAPSSSADGKIAISYKITQSKEQANVLPLTEFFDEGETQSYTFEHCSFFIDTVVSRITYAKFPPGVFDPTKPNDFENVQIRCQDYLEKNASSVTRSQVLGCHIFFNTFESKLNYALGTLRMGKNLFDSPPYPVEDMNMFFTYDAMATMIDQNCFYLDTKFDEVNEKTKQYSDASSYTSEIVRTSGFDVVTKGGYVTVSGCARY